MNNYSRYNDSKLSIQITEEPVVLDLFAGCGGLSLGFESVGFGYDEYVNEDNTKCRQVWDDGYEEIFEIS